MEKTIIRTYHDLLIWKKAIDLVAMIYLHTKNFPNEETYGLKLQIRKCAVSIPSNIAEGYGRNSTNDYIRFLKISMGSLFELETQLYIAFNLEYIAKENYEKINENCKEIERMLSSLIKKLKLNHQNMTRS